MTQAQITKALEHFADRGYHGDTQADELDIRDMCLEVGLDFQDLLDRIG